MLATPQLHTYSNYTQRWRLCPRSPIIPQRSECQKEDTVKITKICESNVSCIPMNFIITTFDYHIHFSAYHRLTPTRNRAYMWLISLDIVYDFDDIPAASAFEDYEDGYLIITRQGHAPLATAISDRILVQLSGRVRLMTKYTIHLYNTLNWNFFHQISKEDINEFNA